MNAARRNEQPYSMPVRLWFKGIVQGCATFLAGKPILNFKKVSRSSQVRNPNCFYAQISFEEVASGKVHPNK